MGRKRVIVESIGVTLYKTFSEGQTLYETERITAARRFGERYAQIVEQLLFENNLFTHLHRERGPNPAGLPGWT